MSIALKASNGQYVCAEGGGGREVVANRGAIGPWETFSLVQVATSTTVALKASNGQYVCAEGGGGREVVANRGAIGPWETFSLVQLDNNKVALKASNGQYVCAEGGGGREVVANRGAIGPWETFSLVQLDNNKVALKASNGQYVCAEGSGGREVVANRGAIGPWETFDLVQVATSTTVALKASNGQYVCAEGGGGREVVANRGAIGPWETFSLVKLDNNKVALKASNGQYVCAEGGGGREVVANRGAIGPWETFDLVQVTTSPPVQVTTSQNTNEFVCGDLLATFVNKFQLVWNDRGSGGKFDGSYYKPLVPNGYYALGYYGQGNYDAPNGVIIAVKELKSGALASPVDYELIWEDRGSGAKMDGAFWRPIPPSGYVALGMVVVEGYGRKPSKDEIVCVRSDLVVKGKPGNQVWLDTGTGAARDFGSWAINAGIAPDNEKNFYLRPGTFFGVASHSRPADNPLIYCLKVPSPKKCLLDLKYVYEFQKIWDDANSGAIFDGSIYKPIVPQGYYPLGHLAAGPKYYPSADEINTRAVLVAKGLEDGILTQPIDFEFIGSDRNSGAKLDCSWWRPIPLPGYAALGTVFAPNYDKPPLNSIMCVRLDQITAANGGKMMYADRGSGATDDVSLFEIRPNGKGLNVGATVAIPYYIHGGPVKYSSDELYTLSCPTSDPVVLTRKDIEDIIARRGPVLHFHPQERYFTMSVEKFLADSYKVDDKHLDIRHPETKLGDLANSTAYVFVEQVHPQFTDIEFWFFHGHNGKTYIHIEAWTNVKIPSGIDALGGLNVGSGTVFEKDVDEANNGEHVGDWEHITLRVSNATKNVVAVAYSSHGDPVWYKPNNAGHIDVYSALNMHGSYPQPKTYLELAAWKDKNIQIGTLEVKIFSRNICASGGKIFEAYKNYQIVESQTLEIPKVKWLQDYAGFSWGPSVHQVDNISIYGITDYTYDDNLAGPSTPSFQYE